MKLLVTGATGFVGQSLVAELLAGGFSIAALVRNEGANVPSGVSEIIVSDLTTLLDSTLMLNSIDVVIHVAGRAHIMNDGAVNPLDEFRKVNAGATLHLAEQAAESGVKRFIFISSIKVNGEMTKEGAAFHPYDAFVPDDPYGLSKYEAERGLLFLSKKTGMEVVIIRPPLIYGPNVRANFASMMKWVNKGIPLPFGAIHNIRSFVALDNLVSFIAHCIDHPKAANEVFLISDNEDVSTTKLLQKVAKAFGKKAYLLPIPTNWMFFVAKLVGKEDVANRLFSSLQVDSSKARNLLDWMPVTTMDEQLKKTADAYLNEEIF